MGREARSDCSFLHRSMLKSWNTGYGCYLGPPMLPLGWSWRRPNYSKWGPNPLPTRFQKASEWRSHCTWISITFWSLFWSAREAVWGDSWEGFWKDFGNLFTYNLHNWFLHACTMNFDAFECPSEKQNLAFRWRGGAKIKLSWWFPMNAFKNRFREGLCQILRALFGLNWASDATLKADVIK